MSNRQYMGELTDIDVLRLLQTGAIEVEGLLPWSSNYSFLVLVHGQLGERSGVELQAVYKPRQGERPLWDFARGTLCQRERAAFVVSEAMGWRLVPPTVLREGPHGIGSVQLFVDHDPECHYFTFEGKAAYRRPLQQIVLLDYIINNADRKGGHVLLEDAEESQPKRLWAIDHGICFHTDYKLRTVIWEFAGQPIPAELLADLNRFKGRLATDIEPKLRQLLSRKEIIAMNKRLDLVIERAQFWQPGPGRHYPWPPV